MSDRLRKLIRAAEIALAAAASLCFGVSFGHSYGVDNQVVYMIGALRLLDPSILQRDWFATQTTHYHPAFKYLAAALIALDRNGWAVAIGQTLAIAGGMLCVYALLRTLVGAGRALPSFLVVLAISLLTRTSAAGASYVFDWTLQPSTLGSVGLLAAAACFARGQWLASGACAAGAGLFHVNYLVLLIPAMVVGHVALGRRELVTRLLLQLALPVVVLLMFLPMLLGAAGSPGVAQAQQIIFNIRAPHHYAPGGYEEAFIPSVAWLLLGGGGALYLTRDSETATRRITALIAGLLAVIWGGLVFSTLIPIGKITQLFSWRIGPHANLLLQALACGAAVTVLTEPRTVRRAPGAALALVLTGAGLIGMVYGTRKQAGVPSIVFALLGAAILAPIAGVAARAVAPAVWAARLGAAWRRAGVPVALVGSLAILTPAAVDKMKSYRKQSTVLTGIGHDEEQLYRWMREKSPKDAIFLTPPDVETMRYWGQRAIVVDWKSNAMLPGEVQEWIQRLKDVTGKPQFSGRRDLSGYDSLDAQRLSMLRARYGVDYVVVRRGRERDLGGYPTAFANGRYAVLDVRGGR